MICSFEKHRNCVVFKNSIPKQVSPLSVSCSVGFCPAFLWKTVSQFDWVGFKAQAGPLWNSPSGPSVTQTTDRRITHTRATSCTWHTCVVSRSPFLPRIGTVAVRFGGFRLFLLVCFILFYFILFLDFMYLFLETGKGGRKRRRETSMCGCLSHAPCWGPGPQSRHVP